MNQLSPELLQCIFLNLDPPERLKNALVCRKWAGIISKGALLEDIWLDFFGSEMDKAAGRMINSQRHYRNLRVFRADLTKFNSEFWTKVGKHLHRLELTECTLTSEVFYKILRNCPQLRCLQLQTAENDSLTYKKLRPNASACLSEVRKALQNVQKLVINMYLDEKLLDQLLELMPNVTTFGVDIGSHGADLPGPLPSLLKAKKAFTILHLTNVNFSDRGLIELLKPCSRSLRELRLDECCEDLSGEGYSAISRCTELRCLSLASWCDNLEDPQLEAIILNAPRLENLNLGESRLTDASLVLLTHLRRLKRLKIYCAEHSRHDAISALGRITSLRSLNLTEIEFNIDWMKNIARLTNLRELTLWSNTDAITPECFNMICENFPGLEELRLRSCESLSDEEGKKLCLFTRLKGLTLNSARGLTDVTFERGLPTSLEYLEMDSCNLTDVALIALASHNHRLRELDLFDCTKITDAGIVTLLRRQTHLERLELPKCKSLTGRFLIELADLCPRLRGMDLLLTPACDSKELQDFRKRRPLVRAVSRIFSGVREDFNLG